MIMRKTPSHVTTTSCNSSCKSVVVDDGDADDEKAMSSDECLPQAPLTVMIPKPGSVVGPYCPRRPNLREILSNTSPAPWTLTAFMAYLSNNHCLETLEFTMDAGRYRKHYQKMMSRAVNGELPPLKDREYVQALWQRLVEAYILPNGSREVNLPSEVRDPIVHRAVEALPPPPNALDTAVAKIYELMEDSVLVPFLNSFQPQSAHPALAHRSFDLQDDEMSVATSNMTYDQRPRFARRGHSVRSTAPNDSPPSLSQPFSHPLYFRKSAPAPITLTSRKSPSNRLSHTTSTPAAPESARTYPQQYLQPTQSLPGMTDDSGSAESPCYDSPDTPPTTPPVNDLSQGTKRDSMNLHHSGVWQKLGGKLGRMSTSARRKNSDKPYQHRPSEEG